MLHLELHHPVYFMSLNIATLTRFSTNKVENIKSSCGKWCVLQKRYSKIQIMSYGSGNRRFRSKVDF